LITPTTLIFLCGSWHHPLQVALANEKFAENEARILKLEEKLKAAFKGQEQVGVVRIFYDHGTSAGT
jgi:hypothetical protein